ncbi:MAG: PIN domain-containing protein [Verrucomicrobiota bacterium]
MILLDTGYFIALFTPDDNLHERAIAWCRHVNEPLLVTEYVLWECVNALSQPQDRPSAHALIEHVQSDPTCELVHASPILFEAGLQWHRDRPDKGWSLTDCISFAVMKEWKTLRALAYDHHFEQAGFEALLRKDPPAS